ncbi:hypothetical protein KUV44_12475 [Marinobacter daepoensis]|uniref:Uncharacterized protein n=1 Tax=Marinobacter daepoensis TaxID=262077 RepID=A0ABS3BKW8_9GAMM|nr:hypothetical protein [Marinobacter daepoensis]MBN7771357.1 hypothetical protein [Marinobacter daepoensis]MBY6079958.1 hypothetical protein [Marinobacter daepoensis]
MNVSMYRNLIWLVVESTDLEGIVDHLKGEADITSISDLGAADDLRLIWRTSHLVVADLGGLIYVGGWGLPFRQYGLRDRMEILDECLSNLAGFAARLSQKFGTTYGFGDHQGGIYNFWFMTERGQITRKYAVYHDGLQEYEQSHISAGEPTEAEVKAANRCYINGLSTQGCYPDEADVREIATNWVLDPQQFSQRLVRAKLIEWSLKKPGA